MKLRSRILLAFVVVVGGGFYLLVQWIGDDLRPRYLESMEETLVDVSHLLAEGLAEDFGRGKFDPQALEARFARVYERRFRATIYALEKATVDLRCYITDPRGRVLFHSHNPWRVGQDYSRWNDVYLTLKGEYGARATWEGPDQTRLVLYIAAPVIYRGELVGVVSVGKPADNADRFIASAKAKLAVAGGAVALGVIVLGGVLTLWLSHPLEALIRYAFAVKAGERVAPPSLGRHEIGTVASAMEEMRVALEGRDYAKAYVQSLTHELKSPLAAIQASAELLDETMPVADRRRFLANIRTETQRLHDLVERLLELAALEQRSALDNPAPVALDVLVRDEVASLGSVATQKGVRVDVVCNGQECRVWGEGFLLRQALANLLRNALEFTPPHSRVGVVMEVEPGAVEVRVEDQGPGLPEYALNRAFERFYSLQRPGGPKGTGLGLSFVKEVAELHRGRVWLENRSEGGARAVLQLPRSSPG